MSGTPVIISHTIRCGWMILHREHRPMRSELRRGSKDAEGVFSGGMKEEACRWRKDAPTLKYRQAYSMGIKIEWLVECTRACGYRRTWSCEAYLSQHLKRESYSGSSV